jgi:hypothetical protein
MKIASNPLQNNGEVDPEPASFAVEQRDAAAADTPIARPATTLEVDLAGLRIDQDFSKAAGTQEVMATIPLRKPAKHEWFRVHPTFQFPVAILDIAGELYLVARCLLPLLASEVAYKVLYPAITRDEVLLLWPVKLPDADGQLDTWNESAHIAAARAKSGWIRITSNRQLGAYRIYQPEAEPPEPEWPVQPFEDWLKIAFKSRVISTGDHPVIKRLLGQL